MRILHLVHIFPPEAQGGTETYVQALAHAQAERGIDAMVACGTEDPAITAPRPTQDGDLPVMRFSENGRSRDLDWSSPKTSEEIRRFLSEQTFDLIHLHHWHNLTNDIIRICKEAGHLVVATLSDYFVTCPLFFRVPNQIDTCPPEVEGETCVRCVVDAAQLPEDAVRAAYARRQPAFRAELLAADAVITLSRAQREFMLSMPLFEGVDIQPIAYPSPVVEAAENIEPDPSKPFRIITWGGLVRGKGLHTIVEACEWLTSERKIEVHHYGTIIDQDYRAEVESMAETTPVHFHGRFGRDELTRLFPGHDLAIFPSFYMETHGLVVDEAIQLGLPVIVSDRGAPPERVGERGLVFPARRPRVLGQMIADLANDPSRLEALRSPALPEPYTMDRHLGDIFQVYERVLGRPPLES